jgi:hypothetical protein
LANKCHIIFFLKRTMPSSLLCYLVMFNNCGDKMIFLKRTGEVSGLGNSSTNWIKIVSHMGRLVEFSWGIVCHHWLSVTFSCKSHPSLIKQRHNVWKKHNTIFLFHDIELETCKVLWITLVLIWGQMLFLKVLDLKAFARKVEIENTYTGLYCDFQD